MKNLFFTILTLVSISFTANAQNHSILLGFSGGSNLSNLSYTGDYAISGSTSSRKLGFQGGVDVGIKFNSFSFITGLKYQQRGGKTELKQNDVNNPFVLNDGTTDTGVFTEDSRYTVMSIPLLFRYQTKGDLAFSVTLGPSINMGIGDITTTQTIDLDNFQDIGPNEFKGTYGDQPVDIYRKSRLGFVFSPGVLYKVSDKGYFKANLMIENGGNIVNPNNGINNGAGQGINLTGSIKSTTLSFEVGYEHRLDLNIGSKY
jgi:hypothetical protein